MVSGDPSAWTGITDVITMPGLEFNKNSEIPLYRDVECYYWLSLYLKDLYVYPLLRFGDIAVIQMTSGLPFMDLPA